LTDSPSFLTNDECAYAAVIVLLVTVVPLLSSIYTASYLTYSLTASSALLSYYCSVSYYYVASVAVYSGLASGAASGYYSLISVFPSALSVWAAALSSSVSESFDFDFI